MKRNLLHFHLFTLLIAVGLFQTGCDRDEPPELIPRFHIEVSKNLPDPWRADAELPISEATIHYNPQPLLLEGDVIGVDAYQVDKGRVIQFRFSPRASQALWRATASNIGKRIYLFINGKPIGHHLIEAPNSTGQLFMWMEIPDEDVIEFTERLKTSVVRIQEMKDD